MYAIAFVLCSYVYDITVAISLCCGNVTNSLWMEEELGRGDADMLVSHWLCTDYAT